ncbi:DUF5655 domain-containing protein [Kitasatospora purpeofusca]|uniref:DUF5655 domain-containing protein n=1 Tax=Kitasatospora purpeofusca TaxID=67352 RepID=UPI002253CC59|nr:DUF5655 domain-containing protein [Kitasatospora purpeofusca]MCX4752432.1 hypothetical protein [Kitasatospora purpeofusca]WSR32005.1 hypothetical protein OG715_14045 [Kitasatospora purpeofusca]
MSDLKVFRLGADGQDVELRSSTVALEVQLQRRVEASMEAMLGIRFLASEYPTGPWHRGRVDSLGLDENGVPVVIEFKKGNDSGVVSQAVSYLTWLKSSRHEFEALVREKLGAEVAESVDWRAPRALCIAAGFSHHDRVAVGDLGRVWPIGLVRYRVFDGGLLSLQLVEPVSAAVSTAAVRRSNATVVPPAAEASELPVLGEAPECLRDLYGELDEALTASGEVEVVPLRHYIAYRRLQNVASVIFRPSPSHRAILLYLRLDPDTVELEEGFTRDMRGIGHLGTGDLEVRIASAADLEKAVPLTRRAVEAA